MSAPFTLAGPPSLSRSTVDRQEPLRIDTEGLHRRWPKARVLPVSRDGRTPVRIGERGLSTRPAADLGPEPPAGAVFLGELDGVDFWTVPGEPAADARLTEVPGSWGLLERVPEADGERWVELRGFGDQLDDTASGLFTTAVALGQWHHRSRFCARCGSTVEIVHFGWMSRCVDNGHEEYPRTDPAVICLVHDLAGTNGERVLLAHQPIWPEHRYSVLAGFVEAGESLEGCVAREIEEEVGAVVRDIRYLGSQPWPFPRSIMLGFTARADPERPLTLADGEIAEAYWVTREQVRAAFANSAERGRDATPTPIADGRAALVLPGNSSIARVMLEAWADAEP